MVKNYIPDYSKSKMMNIRVPLIMLKWAWIEKLTNKMVHCFELFAKTTD